MPLVALSGDAVVLQGSGEDPDGDTLTYAWEQVAGAVTVTLEDAHLPNARFVAPQISEMERLSFRFSVSDGERTTSDTVVVTLLARQDMVPLTGLRTLLFDHGEPLKRVGVLTVDAEGLTTFYTVHPGTQEDIARVTLPDDFVAVEAIVHPDINDNGSEEVGIFGINTVGAQQKPRYLVYDSQSGALLRLYNWPANWTAISFLLLSDMSGDGLPEPAIQGISVLNARPQLLVRDGATGQALATYNSPAIFRQPRYMQLSDYTGDGVEEVGFFGVRPNGKPQIRINDGSDRARYLGAYNSPDNWDNPGWHRLSDSDGDGVDDWGLFGIRKDDGRAQLLNRRGASNQGVLRIFTWPTTLQQAQFVSVPDMTYDDIDEVAAFGVRPDINRYQLLVRNGQDRSATVANYVWPRNWDEVSVEILPDITGDGIAEIGLLGKRKGSGLWQVAVRNGVTTEEHALFSLEEIGETRPHVFVPGDVDEDGLLDLMYSGADKDGRVILRRASRPEE